MDEQLQPVSNDTQNTEIDNQPQVVSGSPKSKKLLTPPLLKFTIAAFIVVIFGSAGSVLMFFSHADSGAPQYMQQTPLINGAASLGLDATGAKVPDSGYHFSGSCDVTANDSCPQTIFMATNGNDVTGTGSKTAPVVSLNRAIALASNGWTIVIRGGTYRDWYNDGAGNPAKLNKSITFQAYPSEQVWFSGMDIIPTNTWRPDGAGHWYRSWNTPSFCGGTPANNGATGYYLRLPTAQASNGPCAIDEAVVGTENSLGGDPQMVRVDSTYLGQVNSLAATGPAHDFFYDFSNHKLSIPYDPNGRTVQITARPTALQVYADNVKILGIGFKDYATNQYTGNATRAAVVLYGNNETIQNSAFTGMAGGALGASKSLSSRVDHSLFVNNGANGINWNGSRATSADIDNVTLTNNLFYANNAKMFATQCSSACTAANVKMAHINGATIKNNVFQYAQGRFAPGYWCDLNCNRVNIVNNLAQGNAGPGIFYEVSGNGIIASNMVLQNSLRSTGYPGIDVSSANTEVYNNTVIGNSHTDMNGIWVYDDSRTPNGDGEVGPDTANVDVVNNIIETNGVGLSAFGPDNGRAPNRGADQLFKWYDYNMYFVPSGPVLGTIHWRPLGTNTVTSYPVLSQFMAAKIYENHGKAQYSIPNGSLPGLTDAFHGDYSAVSGGPAYHAGTIIPADVAAAMGTTTAAGQNRGALNWPGK